MTVPEFSAFLLQMGVVEQESSAEYAAEAEKEHDPVVAASLKAESDYRRGCAYGYSVCSKLVLQNVDRNGPIPEDDWKAVCEWLSKHQHP